MKTTTPASVTHVAQHQHPIRSALGMIVLSGTITAVIVAAVVEIVGGIVSGSGPTTMTHVIAAMLAIPIGYAIAMTLAVGELARGMDVMFERVVNDVQGIRARGSEAANARTATEYQHVASVSAPTPAKQTGMMVGLIEGVEHDQAESTAHVLQRTALN